MAKGRDSDSLDSFNYVQALKHASKRAGAQPRARAAPAETEEQAPQTGAQQTPASKPTTSRTAVSKTAASKADAATAAAPVAPRAPVSVARTAIPTKRLIVCYACGYSHTAAGQLRVPYCPKCKTLLNANDLTIDSKCGEDTLTIGDVAILPGAEFDAGLKVAGKIVKVGADVSPLASLTATEELVLLAGSKTAGVKIENFSGKTIVPAGETVEVEGAFTCTELDIGGKLCAATHVERGATLRAGSTLHGSFAGPRLTVEDGATISADARIEPR